MAENSPNLEYLTLAYNRLSYVQSLLIDLGRLKHLRFFDVGQQMRRFVYKRSSDARKDCIGNCTINNTILHDRNYYKMSVKSLPETITKYQRNSSDATQANLKLSNDIFHFCKAARLTTL